MLIDFAEIIGDLELKRAAHLPQESRPLPDVTTALGDTEIFLPPVRLDREDGSESALALEDIAGLVAEALGALAAASGEEQADTVAGRAIVRAITARVAERLTQDAPDRLSAEDLLALVEAALIETGHIEVAKALVICRAANANEETASPTDALQVVRRSGEVTAWNAAKIEAAIRKAFMSLHADPTPATALTERISERVRGLGEAYVTIETIQNLVQEELVLGGYMKVAERYIVYRAERAMIRAQQAKLAPQAPTRPPVPIVGEDGEEIAWDGADLVQRIAFAADGLDLDMDHEELERELRRAVRPGIRLTDLRRLIVLNSKTLVERDSELSKFAARILLTYIYEETLDWDILRDGVDGLATAHRAAFRGVLERGVEISRMDAALLEFDIDRLAADLDPSADREFDFLGVQTLYDRYLITDKTGASPVRIEAPQIFWLRVAMGVCLAEAPEERTARTLDLYRMYRERRFCSSTPTLFNAGTPHSQLSSCYLYHIQDTLASIVGRGIGENAMCSKWAGGLGGSWTAVRGTGSFIESTNGESQGVVPFLKMHNDQLVAVNQGGKRAGSGCAYLEVWHNDIREFLELRRNTGDERRRTHDMNTACWIPDLFMKRMEAREAWTLFRSNEVPDLHEVYGTEFERRYVEYERRAEAGEIHGEAIPALDLWKAMLSMLFETGHPWITFKDPCNVRSPQDHAGVVHSSNLCTEITLNTGEDETAVCNLGSIVIDEHLTEDGEIDHERLCETVRIAVRALDSVIDVNFYPTEPARLANMRHRPVGLGVMGLQYALYRKGVPFGSDEALAFNDEMMEAIAYYAYEASSDLAAERGRYSSYEGSKWSRGLLPQDTVDLLASERGEQIEVPRDGVMDWAPIRAKIAEQGMRNSNVIAIAPTATIANIMGTSPCIEPMYKNLFAKSNLSGDFMILNPFLVAALKERGLWNAEMVADLKRHDGDLDLVAVPDDLRERYQTAFQIESRWLIDAAARRQKWIDQSQSLNLFVLRPDMKTLSHMYRHAWHAGLKTTYYLRSLGASSIEKSTVSAAVAVPAESSEEPTVPVPAVADPVGGGELISVTESALSASACSIEAMENGEICESCQ